LQLGSRVRLIRVPYFGQEGRVVEMPPELRVIETGAHARVMVVELDGGQKVVAPRANLEMVPSA
jgi:hypothetical protein